MIRRIILVCAALLASPAYAHCATGDLGGSWQVFQYSGILGYQQCGLVVDGNGTVVTNLTVCRDANGVRSDVIGGRFTIKPSCRVEGFASNNFGRFTIDFAWMELDKNTITAVGKDSAGTPMLVQIVRRPW